MSIASKLILRNSTLDLNQTQDKLAEQAVNILGYKNLRMKVKTPGSLAQTLRSLDIKPFTIQSVTDYKRLRADGAVNWNKWMRIIIGISMPFVCFFSMWNLGKWLNWTTDNISGSSIAAGIFLGGAGCVYFIAWAGSFRQRREWFLCDISLYKGDIPEYVLNKAIQVKQSCPDCKLTVEYLVQNTNYVSLDPFLIAQLKDETYYIEVWDEDGFTGEITNW